MFFLAWQNLNAPLIDQLNENLAHDRRLFLATLRRELANYMVRLDPDRYLDLYREARAADTAIQNASKQSQEAQFADLTAMYPSYEDFDFIGVRAHVLYADALSTRSIEEIEAHFLNMVKFESLQNALDRHWNRFRYIHATSDGDLKHLEQYVIRIKDTKFKQRLEAAIREFFCYTSAKSLSRLDVNAKGWIYETDVFAACYVSHYAENRYGFYFKDTNEFGLYGIFFADGRDEPYRSFLRSDAKFEAEKCLDALCIDEPI